MSINLFVDGSVDRMNGYLALSIDNSNIHKTIYNLYHATDVMADILRPIADSINAENICIFDPVQLEGVVEKLRIESCERRLKNGKNMNPLIQKDFYKNPEDSADGNLYLNQLVDIFLDSAERCIEGKRLMIITSDDHRFNGPKFKTDISKNYTPSDAANAGHDGALLNVDSVHIDYADFINDKYRGTIKGETNKVEFNHNWIAYNIPKKINIEAPVISLYNPDKKLLIRPAQMNSKTGRYTFSDKPFVHDTMMQFIYETLIAAKTEKNSVHNIRV